MCTQTYKFYITEIFLYIDLYGERQITFFLKLSYTSRHLGFTNFKFFEIIQSKSNTIIRSAVVAEI